MNWQREWKNDKFTVPQFLNCIKHINMRIAQFPDATSNECFTSNKLTKIFYHSMPIRWQTNFINSGQTLLSTTTDLLRTYMVQQEQQTDAHCKKVRESNKSTQSSSSLMMMTIPFMATTTNGDSVIKTSMTKFLPETTSRTGFYIPSFKNYTLQQPRSSTTSTYVHY